VHINQGRSGMASLLVLLLRLQQCCCHLSLLKNVIEASAIDAVDDLEDLISQLQSLDLDGKTRAGLPLAMASANSTKEFLTNSNITLGPPFENTHSSTKISALLSRLKDLEASNDPNQLIKSVVVSQWTSLLDIVGVHLKNEKMLYREIRGDLSIAERSRAVEEFNSSRSGPRVMLLSLKAGGVGLNLIGGSHLFLMDIHWNPALESQVCDRIHRVGQTRNVHIYRFICKDTIEIKIGELQERKRKLARNILGGQAITKSALTLQDLRMLFGV